MALSPLNAQSNPPTICAWGLKTPLIESSTGARGSQKVFWRVIEQRLKIVLPFGQETRFVRCGTKRFMLNDSGRRIGVSESPICRINTDSYTGDLVKLSI